MRKTISSWLLPEKFEQYYKSRTSEQDLADAYAFSCNEYWSVVGDEDDYEIGTTSYGAICTIIDEWHRIMKDYEQKMFKILEKEGVTIPSTGRIKVISIFMNKYGYIVPGGWWRKKDGENVLDFYF